MALPREGVVKKEKKPEIVKVLNKIFRNRSEAEFAFELLAITISKLKIGKQGDIYYPIEVSQTEPSFHIDFPGRDTPLLGFGRSKFHQSCMLEVLLQTSAGDLNSNHLYLNFDKYDTDPDVRLYKMPLEFAISQKENIIDNYENVLETFVAKHRDPISFKKNPDKEIDQRAVRDIFLDAVSDSNDRNGLLIGIDEDRFSKQLNYSLEQCSNDSGFDVDTLKRWTNAINRKGQIIIYGPPGTGKTYMAEKLARHLISGGDGYMDLVQFHPAFAYEDFIQGIRPQTREDGTLGYPLIPGRFLEFCFEAQKRKDTCVIIIDEINRADLAKVFGELLYLLEFNINGRRNKEIPLSSGRYFSIPNNVRIIGTMNTADRSIALVDHALRRRFAFIHLGPNYDILKEYHIKKNTGFPVNNLVGVLKPTFRTLDSRR